ncbi:MAG: DUF692 domain-containing protein [Deltaproteobacteria bacterium]|nr:DUF692 domain-containing protein [Deltaproteobacteria bacterium]
MTSPSFDSPGPLQGIGVSATFEEAARLCQWRAQSQHPAWSRLDYLQLGIYSHQSVPPSLPGDLHAAGLDAVVHLLELNLMRPLELQAEAARRLVEQIERIGPVCVEEDLGLWRWGHTELEQHMLPPVFDQASLDVIVDNVQELQAMLRVPLFVENPPVYFVVGDLDLLTFMRRVAERSRCGLVLDIGHLVGYCAATGRDPHEYLDDWDGIEHVRELHVAGYDLRPDSAGVPMWYDNHAAPVSDYALGLVELARRRARRQLPVTLEQEGATFGRIASHIQRVSHEVAA